VAADNAWGRDRDDAAPAFPFAGAAAFLAAPLQAQQRALAALPAALRESWLLLLDADPRRGRRDLASRLRRQAEREARRLSRWQELAAFDRSAAGGLTIAGVDEVGRGPLAGPVSACALILPPGYCAPGLDDSKRLTAAGRERWAQRLRADALAWAVADVDAATIDRGGIRPAVLRAMREAVAALILRPARVLVDGLEVPPGVDGALAVVDGDARSLCVAGASVIAKVHRDALMRDCERRWPGYGFARNAGYASAAHCAALLALGPSPIHRRSFCGRWLDGARAAGASR
jgi:ribonuclease HII